MRNNGGGHFNHTLFWSVMSPGVAPAVLAEAIDRAFGSFDAFKTEFQNVKADLDLVGRGSHKAAKSVSAQPPIKTIP